jgi:hypothetical protein
VTAGAAYYAAGRVYPQDMHERENEAAAMTTSGAAAPSAVRPDRSAPRRALGPPVSVCGRCERVDHRGNWVQAELVIRALQTWAQPDPPALVHVICPDCVEEVKEVRQRARAASLQGTEEPRGESLRASSTRLPPVKTQQPRTSASVSSRGSGHAA